MKDSTSFIANPESQISPTGDVVVDIAEREWRHNVTFIMVMLDV